MNMYPKFLSHFFIVISVCVFSPMQAQLRIGSANTGLNFREGPGIEFKIMHTIDTSNLLGGAPQRAKKRLC